MSTALVAGAQLRAIIPTTFEDCQRIASMAVKAGMFKGSNDEARQAYATMALMQGAEVGMPPMLALQNIAVINGMCRIWGKAVPALIRAAGHKVSQPKYDGEPFTDAWKVTLTLTRGDTGEVFEGSFSWKQAKRAKLADKDGPWKLYPDRMMYWRALGNLCTDGAPEVLCGMYMHEQMDDDRFESARDVTPVREAIEVPFAPAEDAKQAASQETTKVTAADAAAPQEQRDILGELNLALIGAKTASEAYDAWEELSEDICLAGIKVRQKGESMLEDRLDQLPKLIEHTQDAMSSEEFIQDEEFDMAAVPGAGGGV